MKHKLVRKIVILSTLLALAFSAWGVTPTQASGLTVTNANDSGPGSLRAAIAAATSGDTVTFAGDYTIHLASTLTLDKNLTINGSGRNITLSGDTDGDGTADVQIMFVNPGVTATLKRLTFTKGTATFGGGIYNQGTLSVTDSTFTGNSATSAGGGIYNMGLLSVTNSTFSGNSAVNGGGGIVSHTATGTCASNSEITIANSTFSGNSATSGGGFLNYEGVATLLFNTFTANTSGGGVMSWNDGLTCTKAGGNIIAGNILYDVSAVATTQRFDSLGYNLVGVAGANVDFTQEFNQAGDQTGVMNPKLAPLANTGGSTETHALQPGSPAIDAGTNTGCPSIDQRGMSRPVDGDLNGTATCDIGAYELQSTFTITLRSQKKYDGWVLESTETSNKGGTKNSRSKVFYVGDDALNRQYRGILSFNTGGLPDDAVIANVTLKVKKAGLVGTKPFKTHKGLRVDIRKGKFGTSPKLQLSDFQAKASKNLVGKFSSKLYSGWYKANLGSAASPYINTTGITQFRLRFYKDDNNDFGADYFKFYSGNAPKARRPQLIVEYSFAPIENNAGWKPIIQEFGGVPMALVPPGCLGERCFDIPFWMDVYEVTNAQYESEGYFPGDNRPRETVTWYEAKAFCENRGARLPNEWEWEYAARGPDLLVYPWGDVFDGAKVVWNDFNCGGTCDVGSRPGGVSWVGAYDMSGNAWEWMENNYNPTQKAVRGGSWGSYGTHLLASYRGSHWPTTISEHFGFRCARSY